MAKSNDSLKLVSESMSLTCDSLNRIEVVKASNGMLFKLVTDVRNGSNSWNIYAWSSALCQWSLVMPKDGIPDIAHLDYFNCYMPGSRTAVNPVAVSNWKAMKDFIIKFVDALTA